METKKTKETKIAKDLESFLKSDEYLSLEKEVKESVAQALASEEGEDIEPVMRLFDQQMAKYQPDAISREKLFWGIVAGTLKDGEFRKIHTEVGPLLDDASKAEQFLNKKLSEIIEKLSPKIYRNLNRRGDAFRVLKSRFYAYFPEVGDLMVGAQEGKKTKMTVPTGRTEQETWERGVLSLPSGTVTRPELGAEEAPLGYVEEKNWSAPNLKEIKPGLIIEFEDKRGNTGAIYKMEVISKPYKQMVYGSDTFGPGVKEIYVKMRPLGNIKSLNPEPVEYIIVRWGLAPFTDGLWSNFIIPVKWYIKQEK